MNGLFFTKTYRKSEVDNTVNHAKSSLNEEFYLKYLGLAVLLFDICIFKTHSKQRTHLSTPH